MNNQVTDETPLCLMTLGQLKKALSEGEKSSVSKNENKGRRYVYGINGIASLLHVSISTAHRLKRTVIKEAVFQQGRIIATDAEKAMELFRTYKN